MEGSKATVLAEYPEWKGGKKGPNYHSMIYTVFPNKIGAEVFDAKINKPQLFTSDFIYMIWTDAEGNKSYCTFLKFQELVLIDGGSPLIVPKAICLISNQWMFKLHRQFLNLIFKNVILNNNIKSVASLADDPMNYILNVEMAMQIELKEDFINYLKGQLEYYISLIFYYLHIPSNHLNFELKVTDKIFIQYQNVTAK